MTSLLAIFRKQRARRSGVATHEYWEDPAERSAQTWNHFRLELEQNRPCYWQCPALCDERKKKLLRALVSWSVRGLIVVALAAAPLKAHCYTRFEKIKTTDEVLEEIKIIVPSDDEFLTAFGIARVPKGAFARYFLIALERGKRGDSEPEFVPNSNEDEVNLEHVLPKRAAPADWASFTQEEKKDYVSRLGNMALLQKGPNGRIGNKPFSAKKPILKKSEFELTKEIASPTTWTADAINKRQKTSWPCARAPR